jgi:hypothetical protein
MIILKSQQLQMISSLNLVNQLRNHQGTCSYQTKKSDLEEEYLTKNLAQKIQNLGR